MIVSIIVLAVLGFCISLYTYLIEKKIKTVPSYKPACDISDRISCTKPMKSPYANILFISNAFVGMLFYGLIVFLAFFNAVTLLLIAAIGGVLVSCFLAYLLYFKIKSLCILCTSMYIINLLILILSIKVVYA